MAQAAASASLGAAGPANSLPRVSASEGFGTWFVAHRLPAFTRAPWRGPLVTRKLRDYRLRFYANSRLVPASADIKSIADPRRHVFVGYVPDLIYAPELDYLNEVGGGLQAHLRSTSINAQYRLIAAGAGIGVLPCFIGDADPLLAPPTAGNPDRTQLLAVDPPRC